MKNLKLIFVIFISIILLSCDENKIPIDKIEIILNDSNAEKGKLDIAQTKKFYEQEKNETDSVVLDKGRALEELRLQYKKYTVEQLEEIIEFYEEYNKLDGIISSAPDSSLTGDYIGLKEDNDFRNYVFVYKFSGDLKKLDEINFDAINKFFNESELIIKSSEKDERLSFFLIDEYLVSVSGKYNDKLDEIKKSFQ